MALPGRVWYRACLIALCYLHTLLSGNFIVHLKLCGYYQLLLTKVIFIKQLAPKSREDLTLKISCDREGVLKIGAHAVPVIYGFHKA